MKANELMTGDWVKLKKDHCKFLQLTAIDETYNSINYFDGDAEGELTLQLTAIEPIPLTPEILEKNGFTEDSYSQFSLQIHDGSIRFFKHRYGLYCTILRPYQKYDGVCNYVHHFQQALRLCGIEKEIVL